VDSATQMPEIPDLRHSLIANYLVGQTLFVFFF